MNRERQEETVFLHARHVKSLEEQYCVSSTLPLPSHQPPLATRVSAAPCFVGPENSPL